MDFKGVYLLKEIVNLRAKKVFLACIILVFETVY